MLQREDSNNNLNNIMLNILDNNLFNDDKISQALVSYRVPLNEEEEEEEDEEDDEISIDSDQDEGENS